MDELKRKAEDALRSHLLRCFNDVLKACGLGIPRPWSGFKKEQEALSGMG